ncbi:MAG: HlyD family efflux transporter periplasmic adaptor subunit [Rhodocyclaceae bacterium]|nr:HlyD family efflux transporter periplasmic adaptor subunit [Rhodocyclaceae bacterium]MCA3736203.1 HlyD family efflux transporter periplasmic adaptor subunit [Phenylobacterium sp.]
MPIRRLLLAGAAALSIGGLALPFLPPQHMAQASRVEAVAAPIAAGRGILDIQGGLTQIAAARDGIVAEVLVEEGARVAPGALLARLDDRLVRAQHAVAEAELAERNAAIGVLEARLSGALREQDRAAQAVRANAAARQLLDQASTDVAVLRAEIAAAEAARDSAAARLRAAAEEVEAREVRAPAGGTIVRRTARPGDGVSTLQVSTLFWFAPDTARIARVEIDEAHAARLRPGLPAELSVEVAEGEGLRWRGRVQQVGAAFAPRRVQVYEPRERGDVRVLEAVLAFEGAAPELPLGTRLVARILPAEAGR